VAMVEERLDPEAAERLRKLAVSDREPLDPEKALVAIQDILDRLRTRRRKEQARAIRMRIAEGAGDLREMNALLEEKRAAHGISTRVPEVPSPR